MPFEAWLKGPLKEIFCDTISKTKIEGRGLIEWQEAVGIQRKFLEGHLAWPQPWLLMILELWCQEVLDKLHRPDKTCYPERSNEDDVQ